VEKVIVEPLETARGGTAALIARLEEAQRRERVAHRVGPRQPTTFHGDRIARQRKTDDGDADPRGRPRIVRDPSVLRVQRAEKVAERGTLNRVEYCVVRKRPHSRRRLSRVTTDSI